MRWNIADFWLKRNYLSSHTADGNAIKNTCLSQFLQKKTLKVLFADISTDQSKPSSGETEAGKGQSFSGKRSMCLSVRE